MRFFSVALVIALLTARLGSFTEEVFVTPVEDCLFGSDFIAAENDGQGKLRNFLKGSVLLDCDTVREEIPPVVLRESPFVPLLPPVLVLATFPRDIFIPPEARSAGTIG